MVHLVLCCTAWQECNRYNKFSGLHGKETPGIFDVNWGDQWSMLGLGRDDKIEQKDKQGHGKGEDKGKLSPWRVIQLGAAPSTSFIRVPPPLLPSMGGPTLGLVLAVGGVGGHMKLEPLAKFIGKGFPTIWD